MKIMLDSVDAAAILPTADASAGYIDGNWPSSFVMRKRFPSMPHVTIAVFARDDAMALDCEPGDATIQQAPAWCDRQHARGVALPIIYTSTSNVAALRSLMGNRQYLVWAAHYTMHAHLCGSGGCTYPAADATQFSNMGPNNENVDQTLMSDRFYAAIGGTIAADSSIPDALKVHPSTPAPTPIPRQDDHMGKPLKIKVENTTCIITSHGMSQLFSGEQQTSVEKWLSCLKEDGSLDPVVAAKTPFTVADVSNLRAVGLTA